MQRNGYTKVKHNNKNMKHKAMNKEAFKAPETKTKYFTKQTRVLEENLNDIASKELLRQLSTTEGNAYKQFKKLPDHLKD